jgi:hypothetical protein
MTDHVSLRDLCREHGRIPSTVLEALASQRFDDLGLTAAVAEEISSAWRAEDEQRTAAELAAQRRAAEKAERERGFKEGERLLAEVGARTLDLQFTHNQIDHTSDLEDLRRLEARLELEMEDHLAAVRAWGGWKREHPEMAAAVELAKDKGLPVSEAGPWRPPAPDWNREGAFQ